ncbi:hypothetical protein BV22DRAFT_1088163 [Leucogyrophana mollusca]|uniref:Uncharacterized protein n=1 Tax=Leucogyrophana mollusca TaxID=85980 RepID=A0ACB8BMT0_9AGAM|nr:hypothetical protein BV22DRAFT_1088163 [Leucogyrophana mollusca]
MARRSSNYEFSIPGDELEHHRIQLENNLQHTDISLHLSSAPDEPDYDNESVEYGRHGSAPSFSGFASFEGPSRENFDAEGQSHMHAWSYHDDEGINPYGAETMSTAAHHASGLTLSAGLGGRGARRDVSLSGAEYDPDRPLQEIIAGMDSKLSVMDSYYHSKSRQLGKSASFEPPIIDSPGDIDRSVVSLAARLRSPVGSKDSCSESESDRSHDISRPKLSDTLQRVGFSPRRPRNVPARLSHRAVSDNFDPQGYPSHSPQRVASSSKKTLTPKPRKMSTVSFDPDATSLRRNTPQPASYQPVLHVQPPTPSSAGSKFTKMARSLARDVQEEQSLWQGDGGMADASTARKSSTSSANRQPPNKSRRHPLHNIVNRSDVESGFDAGGIGQSATKLPKDKVHLPDVTGLTSAVISPAKPSVDRPSLRFGVGQKEVEIRLVASLNALHSKLAHLESENGIARRRVRELEFELEQCKRDVVRERTRVMESQELTDLRDRSAGPSYTRLEGKKKKSREPEKTARYLEVVEEKKALESLIVTLRSHLARVTSDLSSQQQMLNTLRSLRESDVQMLSEKSQEILQLRAEVERLAGEIEVLRGVVEEGLNERRQVREHLSLGEIELPAGEPCAEADDEPDDESPSSEEEPERVRPIPPQPTHTPRSILRNASASHIHTQETINSLTPSMRRFVNEDELERISVELDERRSDRSSSSSTRSAVQRAGTPQPTQLEGHVDSPHQSVRRSDPRPSVSGPVEDSEAQQRQLRDQGDPATPFPRIRAGRLERLFFSAPEHNSKTCTVCHRRRPRSNRVPSIQHQFQRGASSVKHDAAHLPSVNDGSDDEGFRGGLFDIGANPESSRTGAKCKDKDAIPALSHPGDPFEAIFKGDRPPPQTVLARVLRELEDDFTHYKGIYCELAEEYKIMSSTTTVAKRNIVAQHLRDVIDVIERKGNQIASLYDLLKFEDKPLPGSPDQPTSMI